MFSATVQVLYRGFYFLHSFLKKQDMSKSQHGLLRGGLKSGFVACSRICEAPPLCLLVLVWKLSMQLGCRLNNQFWSVFNNLSILWETAVFETSTHPTASSYSDGDFKLCVQTLGCYSDLELQIPSLQVLPPWVCLLRHHFELSQADVRRLHHLYSKFLVKTE